MPYASPLALLLAVHMGAPAPSAIPTPTPAPAPTPTPTPSAFDITKTSATTQTRYAQIVTTPFSGKWAGVAASPTFARDNIVATDTDYINEYIACMNAAATAPAGTWYRIRIRTGVTSLPTADADFKPRTGGGLLIEPDSGYEDMWITDAVGGGCGRGVQVGRLVGPARRGFTFPKAGPGSSIPGAYGEQFRVDGPSGSIYAVFKVQGNKFGLNWPGLGYTENSSNLVNKGIYTIRFFQSEEVQIVDNLFNGFSNAIDAFGCRLVEVARNDFQQFTEDLLGYSAFRGAAELKGVWADDHCYVWQHHNTIRNINDFYQFAAPVYNNGPHVDLAQLRTTVEYPRSGVPGTGKAISVGRWVATNGNYYKCITAGTTDTTTGNGNPPSGTGSDIVDGSVHWQHVCAVAVGPASYICQESNVALAATSDYKDDVGVRYSQGTQFHINSDGAQRSGYLGLNNMQGTRSAYGIQTGGTGLEFARAEYNTFAPTCEIPPAGGFSVANYPRLWSNGDTYTAGVWYARRNICGGIEAGVTDVENIIVKGTSDAAGTQLPNTTLAGHFTANGDGYWVMDYTDDGSVSPATFIQDMYSRLKMKDGSDYGAVF